MWKIHYTTKIDHLYKKNHMHMWKSQIHNQIWWSIWNDLPVAMYHEDFMSTWYTKAQMF